MRLSHYTLFCIVGVALLSIAIGFLLFLFLPTTYTVSIFSPLPPPPPTIGLPVPPFPTLSLILVGDIMLDRSVFLKTQQAKDFNHPFLLIDPFLQQADIRIANLEGPITSSSSRSVKDSSTVFTFSPQFLEPLARRFTTVSLANNHTRDFGTSGLAQTKEFLSSAGVTFFGDYHNQEQLSAIIEKNNIRIGLVGYHALINTGIEQVVQEITHLRPRVDMLIVMPHWGAEYTSHPGPSQKEQAHRFIEAGADLVVGAHPHVIQSAELYQGKYIFYSLGNFVFDQYFSEATLQGLALQVDMTKKDPLNLEIHLRPYTINKKSQPSLTGEPLRSELLKNLATISLGEEFFKQALVQGTLTAPAGPTLE